MHCINIRKTLILTVLLMIVALMTSGCYLYPVEEEPVAPPLIKQEGITYSTYEVKLGNLEKLLQTSGVFKAETYYDCRFDSRGGYVKAKLVRAGLEVKKGDVLLELDNAGIKDDIRRREIQVERAKINLNNAKKSRNKEVIQNAEWDLELAEMDLLNAKDQYEKSVMRAPIDGRIANLANIDVGEYVNANTTLVRVENTENLILEVSGDKVSEFQDGMAVQVVYKKKEYTGEVVMTPQTAPDDMPKEQRARVRIRVNDIEDSAVKLGDDAKVVVVLASGEDIIVLPKNLVRNYLGRRYVQLLKDGLPTERDVEIGLETSTQYEIIQGLEVGDLIIDR